MRVKLFTKLSTLLFAVTLLIGSCAKDGDTGPAGATGPAGPAGPAGPGGSAGAPGAPGTANVIYSDWINVTYEGTDTTGWFAEIDAPKLVDSILNRGDVKVYCNVGSDSVGKQLVMALPIYDLYLTGDIINAYFQPQVITLAATVDQSSFVDNGNNYFQYRYVLIPGGTKALRPAKGQASTSIDWNDYKQVKKLLNLKD